jgi:hypothetical protein
MRLASETLTAATRANALELAALVFLAVPVALFFATFTPFHLAIPAVAIIVVCLYRLRPRFPIVWEISTRQFLLCFTVSLIFLWACGYSSPSARTWDWLKHFAVINELGTQSWPPTDQETGTYLRYYLGYYLLPGLAVKSFGNSPVHLYVFAETLIGLTIALCIFARKLKPAWPIFFFALFLTFSGLDPIGYALTGREGGALAHKEWWAEGFLFSYQGQASSFIWAPQHALPALLGVGVLLPEGGRDPPPVIVVPLLCTVAFWSPFVALGLAPIALAATWRVWKDVAFDWGAVAIGLFVGLPLIAYLLSGSSGVPHGPNWPRTMAELWSYLSFVALEFGLLLIALSLCGWRRLRFPSVIVPLLFTLPLYRVGLYNDFTMRMSIPALVVLGLAAAATVSEERNRRVLPLALLMLVGSAASVLEMVGRSQDGFVPAREMRLLGGFLADHPDHFAFYRAPLPHWTIRWSEP